jgi:hypothetical protein
MRGYSVSSCCALLACAGAHQTTGAYRLEFFLYLGYATRRIIWICYVVLVYADIASRSAQHEVDYFCHGSRFVFIESRDPAGHYVFESVAAREYVGCTCRH